MDVLVNHQSQQYQLDISQGQSLAIELNFNQPQPNHFGAAQATKRPMQAGGFIGNTRKNGSCNVNELSFNPHCNGTHTETLGHICHLDERDTLTIDQLDIPALIPTVLISVTPVNACEQSESYAVALASNDRVITKAALSEQLQDYSDAQLHGLVIRTLDNPVSKKHLAYCEQTPNAFFTTQAIRYLFERGVNHLVVDMPSIDKMNDDGLLNNHHIFWDVIPNSRKVAQQSRVNATVTELAYISNEIADGFYFLNLQLPAFVNDAAPSNPVLYTPIKQEDIAVFKE
ncbi:cyclase family protein [Thalassotalea sp. LPB0316]|uniref:cyclase family protein n=1 Tax=Thalassotalea sp. LPB0316 TaxID=2769490 RepID=UPI001868F44B|nr:cyclase family protein [Thalassotalea sp. LPB0316]QOL24490.1 cyclase family protein [Thalassotalea sp. LPB0316]